MSYEVASGTPGPQDMKGMAQGKGMEQTLKDLEGSRGQNEDPVQEDGSRMQSILRHVYSRS